MAASHAIIHFVFIHSFLNAFYRVKTLILLLLLLLLRLLSLHRSSIRFSHSFIKSFATSNTIYQTWRFRITQIEWSCLWVLQASYFIIAEIVRMYVRLFVRSFVRSFNLLCIFSIILFIYTHTQSVNSRTWFSPVYINNSYCTDVLLPVTLL